MTPISVVIITKNEADVIANCITRAMLITQDIVIIDNGSTDDTLAIASAYGCRVYASSWGGYGANKNKGIELARYDWILSIDADELPDIELVHSIRNLDLEDTRIVYDIKFKPYFGDKLVRFGSWGRDHHVRLFNRRLVKWSEPRVHETLVLPAKIKKERLKGYLHHYSVKDSKECSAKAVHYAKLSAEKYFKNGKKANAVNLYLSAVFSFLMSYIVFLGFLDGKEGWLISKSIFKYKWLKYHYLNHMEHTADRKQFVRSTFTVEY